MKIGSSSALTGGMCSGSSFVASFPSGLLEVFSETSAICGSQQQEQLVFQAVEEKSVIYMVEI